MIGSGWRNSVEEDPKIGGIGEIAAVDLAHADLVDLEHALGEGAVTQIPGDPRRRFGELGVVEQG